MHCESTYIVRYKSKGVVLRYFQVRLPLLIESVMMTIVVIIGCTYREGCTVSNKISEISVNSVWLRYSIHDTSVVGTTPTFERRFVIIYWMNSGVSVLTYLGLELLLNQDLRPESWYWPMTTSWGSLTLSLLCSSFPITTSLSKRTLTTKKNVHFVLFQFFSLCFGCLLVTS